MSAPDFHHSYRPAAQGGATLPLLLLHGTGGDERQMAPMADALSPGCEFLSPRGKVLEGSSARFFRRFAEGVLDIEDWRVRSLELGTFVRRFSLDKGIAPGSWIAVGYSNGANIAQGLLLLCPELLRGAILLRPMFVTDQVPPAGLSGREILILSGAGDPFAPSDDTKKIAAQLGGMGARVESIMQPAGHSLLQADLDVAREWLGRLPRASAPARS